MSRRQEQLSLFAAFHKAGVEYAVVGGIAVNAYGYSRSTRDLDVFIRPTLENAQAAFGALMAIGAQLEDSEPADLLMDYEHFQLYTPNGRIDILSSIGEMTFDRVWRGRVEATIDGVPVRFIAKADLIENKRQVGRLRDLADIEELSLLPESDVLRLPE